MRYGVEHRRYPSRKHHGKQRKGCDCRRDEGVSRLADMVKVVRRSSGGMKMAPATKETKRNLPSASPKSLRARTSRAQPMTKAITIGVAIEATRVATAW
jgi:hypothetical protein